MALDLGLALIALAAALWLRPWRMLRGAPPLLTPLFATLAVLPNDPSLVHLKRNRGRLLAKRDRLLRRLHLAGDLSVDRLADVAHLSRRTFIFRRRELATYSGH